MSSAARREELNWRARLSARVNAHRTFKRITIPSFMGVFFAAYFMLLNFPLFTVMIMPTTSLDHWIGFQPNALWLYISLWFYVPLAPILLNDWRELVSYFWAAAGLSLTAMTIFLFWPTVVPKPDIDWSHYPSVGFLKTVDTTGNACPSLHVAFAVFSALWLNRILKRMGDGGWLRGLSWCWCTAIVYSTLATKQHVAVDVVGGMILALLCATIHRRYLLGRARRPAPAVEPSDR